MLAGNTYLEDLVTGCLRGSLRCRFTETDNDEVLSQSLVKICHYSM